MSKPTRATRKPLDSTERDRHASRLAALRAEVDIDDPDLAMRILDRAVATIAGPDAPRRPGQIALAQDIADTLRANPGALPGVPGGRLVAAAPTGVGKSAAQLAPACAAALAGQRTVISTESLSLQAQILEKDGPAMLDACEQVTGVRPTIAVHKGWGNFSCTRSAVDAAYDLLGQTPPDDAGRTGPDRTIAALREQLAPLLAALPEPGERRSFDFGAAVGTPSAATVAEQAALVDWALAEAETIEAGGTGDVNAYPREIPKGGWARVSVASTDCLGADSCPFADHCLPTKARGRVATADIVVTNHTLLGIQAAKAVPVVTGSRTLGTFHHLMVDECHALPATVRGQGASEVSSRAIESLRTGAARALTGLEGSTEFDEVLKTGKSVADEVGRAIDPLVPSTTGRSFAQPQRLGPDDEPLADVEALMKQWLAKVARLVRANLAVQPPQSTQTLRLKRLASRVESMEDAIAAVEVHEVGVARWAEADLRNGNVLRSSPVDVGPILAGMVWQAPDLVQRDDEEDTGRLGDGPEVWGDLDKESTAPDSMRSRSSYELNVVCLSATVPAGFGAQVGLSAKTVVYESPFEAAYADRTALYIPRLTGGSLDRVSKPAGRSRRRFDTSAHVAWAAEQMAPLVEANEGSALILSATTRAGQEYARVLRAAAAGRWQVLSQWDGRPPRRIVADWRADTASVLVGTRSLMTGVDAPGQTCTLVVVDRVPRAAGNVVDDARVEALADRLDLDRWSADRLVYYADARTLLEQASGRLVRGVTDGGMCAVLDPRLLKSSDLAYPEKTRDFLMRALRHFGTKISDPAAAAAWLTSRHLSQSQVA